MMCSQETHARPNKLPEALATRSSEGEDTPDPAPDAYRLLVVERSSSRLVTLPAAGFVDIGRDPEADIRVDDPAASRRHARLQVTGAAVRLIDSGSRNGLSVNGARVEGACDLSPGDVVTLGEAALILRGGRRSAHRRVVLGPQELGPRLQQEIDRSLELVRPLSVAVLSLGPRLAPATASPHFATASLDLEAALAPHLSALDVAGRLPDGTLALAFGERPADEARAAVSLLVEQIARLWPACRAGVASCPDDGCDASTLLGLARDAAEAQSKPGAGPPSARVRDAQQAVPFTLDLGDRSVVMADPSMVSLFALIRRLAAASLTVLISGETGVGKENAAYAVHHGSSRRAGPFVAVNCAAIPDTLVEGELFGHAKGAFSGAHAAKAGLFERAAGGTLFLDEVGELSLAAQAKLLRAIEGGRFLRLGETTEREADVRIVAATNRDLAAEVRAHRFREDLFYRLGSAVVLIPPLRERPADIPVLARAFLAAARARSGKTALAIGAGAMLALARHPWPGNVRELKNAMEYVAASVDHGVVERASLPANLLGLGGALHGGEGHPLNGHPLNGHGASGPSLNGHAANVYGAPNGLTANGNGAPNGHASSVYGAPSGHESSGSGAPNGLAAPHAEVASSPIASGAEPSPAVDAASSEERPPAVFQPLHQEIEALERRRIREALAACGGIKTRAARLIGVPERTFRLKLRQYGFA